TVVNSDGQTGSCGEHDTGGGVIIAGANTTDETVQLPVIGFGFHEDNAQKRLDTLIADAMNLSEVYDTTSGDNEAALELFHAIMTYDYSTAPRSMEDYIKIALNFAYYQMKYTLYNAF